MTEPLTAGAHTSKDVGEKEPQISPPDANVAVRVATGLGNLHTLCYVHEGVTLQELRISWIGSTWRLMLKGRKGRRRVIAYFYAAEWWDLLALTVTSADSHHMYWHDDDHPPQTPVPTYDNPPIPVRTTF